MSIKKLTEQVLADAGVNVGGKNPWDPQVYKEEFWQRLATGGSIALGESYMDKWWDVEDLATMICRIQGQSLDFKKIISGGSLWHLLRLKLFNLQAGRHAYRVGEHHYDLGNDLYEVMLDRRMIYTSAYWKEADTLDEAQENKLDIICRKLNLQKGQRVLDIGCGWGGFMKYASENYGVECVGLSVSKEQIEYGEKVCKGLPVEFVLIDYQKYQPEQQFDHIVSIEMFEAVGHKNYRTFMRCIAEWLRDDGSLLLQTITTTYHKPLSDPWLDKYIFPNGMLPNKSSIEKSIKGYLEIDDWHSLGADYDKTLMAWWQNFVSGYEELDKSKYDERFYRMWKYYLHICAGGFRAGYLDVWQILMTKPQTKVTSEIIR